MKKIYLFLYIAQGESPRRLATALVGLVGPMRPNYWTSWTMVRMELHLQSDGVLQIFTEPRWLIGGFSLPCKLRPIPENKRAQGSPKGDLSGKKIWPFPEKVRRKGARRAISAEQNYRLINGLIRPYKKPYKEPYKVSHKAL